MRRKSPRPSPHLHSKEDKVSQNPKEYWLLGRKLDVDALLARLENIANASLGWHGVVAGQAVASAIFEQFDLPLEPVYNDIDIFVEDNTGFGQRFVLRNAVLSTIAPQVSDVIQGSYGELFLARRAAYKVISTRRKGMLNYVYYEQPTGGVMDLIGTFDMNAVQVGIDLSRRQVYFTDAFHAFLNTRQLEIANASTPLASLIRYHKKKGELKAYGDDEFAAAVALACINAHNAGTFETGAVIAFGKPTLDKFFKLPDQKVITDRFEIRERGRALGEYATYSMAPKATSHCYNIKQLSNVPIFNQFFNEYESSLRESRPYHIGIDVPLLLKLANNKKKVRQIQRLYQNVGKHGRPYLAEAVLLRPELFARWDGNEKQAKAVLKELQRHEELVSMHTLPSFRSQYAVTEAMKSIMRKEEYGNMLPPHVGKELYRNKHRNLRTSELMHAAKHEARKQYDSLKKLNAPEELVGRRQIGDVCIKELSDGISLHQRGEEEHHCVASYASQVANGESVILQLDNGKRSQSATMELRKHADKDGKTVWVIAQTMHAMNNPVDGELAEKYKAAVKEVFPQPIVEKTAATTPQAQEPDFMEIPF